MSAAGQILNGRYRMERQVGSGGFAEVYLATDLGPLGRQVAVKLLHAHLVQQRDFLARFKQEAAMLAQLKHPHILDVYDFGEAGGTIYLVMPYIAGGTLDNLLRTARYLEPMRVSRYLQQIASALDYAHSRRIIHRDLKPGNFLLDEGDSIQLSDFGIAKLLQEATQAYSGIGVLGTLPYMAPESFRGQTGPAIDIYALGCIVFQLLTGATPFTGTTEQVMYAHSFEPIPSLVERSQGRIPPALGPVIARALAKRPEDRYATAGEFAQAFDAVVRGTPVAQEYAQPPAYGQPPATGAVPPTSFQSAPPTYIPPQPMPLAAPPMTTSAYNAPTQFGAPAQPGYGAPVPPIVAPPTYGQPPYAQAPRSGRSRLVWWLAGGASAAVVACLALILIVALVIQPRTPEAQAKSTATALAKDARVVFGPQNGAIKHDPSDSFIETVAAENVSLSDLTIEATFFNPYAASTADWDYGFIFRSTTNGAQYRLIVESSGDWSIELVLDKTTGESNQTVGSGKLTNLTTASQTQNRLVLTVKGDTAYLFVNDTYIATANVGALREAGKVSIATGILQGDEVAGKSTGYNNFKVSSLP